MSGASSGVNSGMDDPPTTRTAAVAMASSSRRRRQIQGSACDDCRRRKARCDGKRPNCSNCSRNEVPWRVFPHPTPVRNDTCYYASSSAERHGLTGVLACNSRYETDVGETRTAARSRITDDLKSENESLRREVENLKQKLAFDVTQSTTLASSNVSNASSPLTSLSYHSMDQAAFPNWLTPVEYDLMLSHPNSYAFNQLPDLHTLMSLHAIRIRDTLGDVQFVSERTIDGKGKTAEQAQTVEDSPEVYSDRQLHHESSWQLSQSASAPIHHDPRLEKVDLTVWSSVVPNEIAGRLIGFYLQMDHPILGHFDADLFVEDLIHFRTEFCSELLVNSLLLWACHGYSAYDQSASTLKNALFKETSRLWGHRGVDSVLTLAAGIFFKMACACNGNDKLSCDIVTDVYEMAHRLDLFGHVNVMPIFTGGHDDSGTQWLRARAHAAWGVFNFITLNAFSLGTPVMRLLPKFVIPGDADTWQLPGYMGTTFTRLCGLWPIVNQIALLYHAEPHGTIVERTSLEFAQRTYGRLLEWADIHGPMIRNWARDPHHQCYVHMVFHGAVLDIFRPFLGLNLSVQSIGERQYTSESIFLASVRQLNYQVLIYRLIHPSAAFVFWYSALVQAANAAIATLPDPSSKRMFLVCLLALHDLSPSFPIMSTVLMGLLCIATRRGAIDKENARHLHSRLRNHTGPSEQSDEESGTFVIDLAAALHGSASITAGQLARSFESSMLAEAPE